MAFCVFRQMCDVEDAVGLLDQCSPPHQRADKLLQNKSGNVKSLHTLIS